MGSERMTRMQITKHARDHNPGGSDPLNAGFWLIEEINLSAEGVITFADIPQTFRHLRLYAMLRTAHAFGDTVQLNLNAASTSAGYFSVFRRQIIDNTQATSGVDLGDYADDQIQWFNISGPQSSNPAGAFSQLILDIAYYSSSVFFKMIQADIVSPAGNDNFDFERVTAAGAWNVTDPVTEIDLIVPDTPPHPGFAAGSRASLYGIS